MKPSRLETTCSVTVGLFALDMFPPDEADARRRPRCSVIASLTRNNVLSPLSSSQPPVKRRLRGDELGNRFSQSATDGSSTAVMVQHRSVNRPMAHPERWSAARAIASSGVMPHDHMKENLRDGPGRALIDNESTRTRGLRDMAIETLGAALRQINRLFANGVVAGLSDAQLPRAFPHPGGRWGLRSAGGAARTHGPERLPGDLARPARCGGRLPGDLPGPGQEGWHDPRT